MNRSSLRLLVEAFVWPLVFFETCDDRTLDPQIAAREIHHIMSALNALGDTERQTVTRALAEIAEDTPEPEARDLIGNLPGLLGWLDGQTREGTGQRGD